MFSLSTALTYPAAHITGMSTPRPPKPGQSLAQLFPLVAAQWHPTRNGELIPDQVSAGSNAGVWWRCEWGHEWEAAAIDRTSKGTGCPVCSGRKVLAGYNDLGTRFPTIAAQWHPTLNGDRRFDQVSAGSNARVWWRCEQGHEWEAAVHKRTSAGNGCPVCTGLKVLTGFNDLGTRFPDIAQQWHPARNGDRTPDQVTASTNSKAWWRCELGHEWEAVVYSRTTGGNGCPVCAGHKVLAGYNDLATTFPAVAAQWHLARNADLTPDQVTAGSHVRVWWKCPSGHEWEAPVGRRTAGHGCLTCWQLPAIPKPARRPDQVSRRHQRESVVSCRPRR